MDIEKFYLTPEERIKVTDPFDDEYSFNCKKWNIAELNDHCERKEQAIANTATDKAIKHFDSKLRPYLEDAIEVLSNAQGEWYSVTKTYAPEWTHPFKELEGLMDEALKKLVDKKEVIE